MNEKEKDKTIIGKANDDIEIEQLNNNYVTGKLNDDMEIKFDVEGLKNEVLEELKKLGAKVIPNVYNGNKEFLKIFSKYNNYFKKYNDDKANISDRYSPNVANEKIKDLNIDFIVEKSKVKEDLDSILKKEFEYKQRGIKDNISNPEYKEARKEALDILLKLGNKLDVDTTFDLIKPIVEAKDLTTLKILKETSNDKTEFIYIGAIREVEQYLNTNDLSNIINSAKNYIDNDFKGYREYILECFLYENDLDLYNSLAR